MNLILIAPEITLVCGAFFTLIFDAFLRNKIKYINYLTHFIGLVICAIVLISIQKTFTIDTLILNDMLRINFFTAFVKCFLLLLLVCVILLGVNFVILERKISSEFIALLMIATAGGMLMISANDFLTFYLALEMQSLPLYILCAINKKSTQSAEAGIKYFILGSLSSALFLFGVSLIYGFSGSINFSAISNLYDVADAQIVKNISLGVMVGFIFVITALLFKISAAPFHMWTPDVYQGSASIITTFFAALVKFSSLIALMNILINFDIKWPGINTIFVVTGIISIIVGSLGAIYQKNIKRLLAYSSIGHVGFMLLGLSALSKFGFTYTVFYAMIYAIIALGTFGFLNIIIEKNGEKYNHEDDDMANKIYDINSLAGLSKTNPKMAFAVAALMFSSAGIPPLAGFFSKFYILSAVIVAGFLPAAIIAIIFSVVSAYYYLKIVKIMYFDKPSNIIAIDDNINTKLIIFTIGLINILLIFMMKPILNAIFNFMPQI